MAKLNVNIGLSVNDKTGDTLRTAFDKINQNFTELYTLTGGTSTALTELAQDYAAPLFNHASHTNITVTYDDANNKILLTGVAAQVQSNWTATTGLGVILNKPALFSGSYTDLTNKPSIPSAYTLPTASASVLGGIKIGTGLSIDVNGVVTASSGSSLVNGAHELELVVNGETPYVTFPSHLDEYVYIQGGEINVVGHAGLLSTNNEVFLVANADGLQRLWVFGTDGTTTFPSNSIKNSLDNSTAITTQRTLTANNTYTNVTDFSTGVDLGSGIGVIAGWYQRTLTQIEFALFGPSAFVSYLTGLALGRTVIVTYNTSGGTSTLTRTLTQVFASTGQTDPNNPSWVRVSGRIDATLPVGQLGIVSINFPVYSTSTNDWNFGANGALTFPNATTQTTAWTGSVSSLVNGAHQLALVVNGEIPYVTFPAVNGVGQVFIQGNEISTDGSIYVSGESDVILSANVTATNGPRKNWTFGTDGTTTFPSGMFIESAMGNALISADPNVIVAIQTNGPDSAAVLAWTDIDPVTSDQKGVSFGAFNGNGSPYAEISVLNHTLSGSAQEWRFNDNGSLTFPDATVQTTAWKGIPGPYANDAAAAAANVAVGNPYHKTGTGGQVFVRLT